MGPIEAIKTCLAKSFRFKGRASRAEYWWFMLFAVVAGVPMIAIDIYVFQKDFWEPVYSFWPIKDLFLIVSSLPIASVSARRLQDISLPGWPAILTAVLFIAWVVTDWGRPVLAPLSTVSIVASILALALMIAAIFPSNSAPNNYGPNPHEVPS